MDLADFDYPLPPALIAQEPLADRSASRMLVVNRRSGAWQDRTFLDLPSFLGSGDCLVLNNSRVIPCRLLGSVGERPVEIFLLRPVSSDPPVWSALAKPGRHLRPGAVVRIAPDFTAEILTVGQRGERTVRLHAPGDPLQALETYGHVPLPPYIRRPDSPQDRARYQTVFAQSPGSVAAPTAGLHFTPAALDRCRAAGASIATVTLHVGLGTFQPLSSSRVEENHLHSERYEIPADTVAAVGAASRVVAAGTTSVRALESAARAGSLSCGSGETAIFIYPGFEFRLTGALLTNFHLPKSSLIVLVAAFAGRDLILAAYHHAIREQYRFFSYGDCMLIV